MQFIYPIYYHSITLTSALQKCRAAFFLIANVSYLTFRMQRKERERRPACNSFIISKYEEYFATMQIAEGIFDNNSI